MLYWKCHLSTKRGGTDVWFIRNGNVDTEVYFPTHGKMYNGKVIMTDIPNDKLFKYYRYNGRKYDIGKRDNFIRYLKILTIIPEHIWNEIAEYYNGGEKQ